jgi:hypothetical protein
MKEPIKDLFNVKVGDKVTLTNPDFLIRDYLKKAIFHGIKIDHLKVLCSMVEGKEYKVVDVCKSCKILKIKIGKLFLPIHYEHINQVL